METTFYDLSYRRRLFHSSFFAARGMGDIFTFSAITGRLYCLRRPRLERQPRCILHRSRLRLVLWASSCSGTTYLPAHLKFHHAPVLHHISPPLSQCPHSRIEDRPRYIFLFYRCSLSLSFLHQLFS